MTAITGVDRITRPNGFLGRHRNLALFLNTPSVLISAAWLVLVVIAGLLIAPVVTEAANRQVLENRFVPPFSLAHGVAGILGADSLGRPVLLQLIVGARTSLTIAICTVALSAIIGTTIGIFSGYLSGWPDAILMRLADVLHTIPSLLLALAVLYVLQPSITNLILVLAVTRLPVYLRTARAQTLELRERTFVESAHAIGSSSGRIMVHDVGPMVVPTIRTLAMLEIATVILASAGLSFLGIGLQRPDMDWGLMVADGRSYLTQAWWVTLFPGLGIVMTALAANIISNWLRAIEDPLHAAPIGRRTSKWRRQPRSSKELS
jgi:peptide/nickel transport system permease protein